MAQAHGRAAGQRVERLGQRGRRGAARRRPVERGQHHAVRVGREPRAEARRRRRVAPGDCGQERDERVALERATPREQLVEHDAEREHVRRRPGPAALLELLGRHVPGRPDDRARRGHARLLVVAGHAEVGQDRRVVGRAQEHVGRLQVAVDDPRRVDVRQGPRHVAADAQGASDVERAARRRRLEVAAGHEVQDHVGQVARRVERVHAHDARVRLEARQAARLAREALGAVGGPRAAAPQGQDLDRPLDAELLVARDEHGPHAAAAEEALEAVVAQAGARSREA
ncbi:MAG: hypothetical protein M9894_11605 [Planctomycetes bacterium]|nr:hypothetical protein [Planctomycetota bacterium]